ncbi:hypothetical protein FRB90_010108 [Tulasnella sp. 427]|nr:hypothetical protein FRB90_010108 [Tulasnella sp. 427]
MAQATTGYLNAPGIPGAPFATYGVHPDTALGTPTAAASPSTLTAATAVVAVPPATTATTHGAEKLRARY